MDVETAKRCPHYQMHSERLQKEGSPSYLAVRRCLLTERLATLLRQSPDGASLADKLLIDSASGKVFAFVGPDFEAVTQRSCTGRRCEERCTPAYVQTLANFGLQDQRQDDVTCDDEDDDTDSDSTKDDNAPVYGSCL